MCGCRTPPRSSFGACRPTRCRWISPSDACPATRRRGPAFEKIIANGYSGTGDVSAPVVYVNYGLIEDYEQLDSIGVSVKGKIAVARYGRSFRGIKAREAEKHGAVGLIIYSDPADDGYVRGDVYPEGPMRAATGVQRGSVYNDNGDPSTPGIRAIPARSAFR